MHWIKIFLQMSFADWIWFFKKKPDKRDRFRDEGNREYYTHTPESDVEFEFDKQEQKKKNFNAEKDDHFQSFDDFRDSYESDIGKDPFHGEKKNYREFRSKRSKEREGDYEDQQESENEKYAFKKGWKRKRKKNVFNQLFASLIAERMRNLRINEKNSRLSENLARDNLSLLSTARARDYFTV